jgi:hypothetical protein
VDPTQIQIQRCATIDCKGAVRSSCQRPPHPCGGDPEHTAVLVANLSRSDRQHSSSHDRASPMVSFSTIVARWYAALDGARQGHRGVRHQDRPLPTNEHVNWTEGVRAFHVHDGTIVHDVGVIDVLHLLAGSSARSSKTGRRRLGASRTTPSSHSTPSRLQRRPFLRRASVTWAPTLSALQLYSRSG